MSQAVRVGIFVTLCLAVLAYLVLKVEDLRLFGEEGRRVEAVFDSVVGLDDKAPVRVAGVRVGRVDGIALDGRRARVSLLLEKSVPLGEGSRASIANAGILGDKYVELIPGPPGAPPLAQGAVIEGSAPASFDQALEKVGELAESVTAITSDLAERDLGEGVARLLANLEAASGEVREMIRANRGSVEATAGNFEHASATLAAELPRLAEQLGRVLSEVEAVVAENREGLGTSLANVRELSESLQVSAAHLNEISSQIASGEGTLGKLIYSDEAHEGLVATLGSVEDGVETLSDTLGRVGEIDFELGLESAYFTEPEETRTALSLEIEPNPSRFYFVELVDDPGGRRRRKTEETTTTLPDGTVEVTRVERLTIEDDFTLSAQFGFRRERFELRAGLFESTGGGAIDVDLFEERLRLSLEAFDFSRDDDLEPHLRLLGRWRLSPHIYLVGGYDDFLVDGEESLFLGAGVRWKDDDLKYLLGSVPRF